MNTRRLIVLNILVLLILFAGGASGFYFYNQATSYIKTDYAKIEGQQLVVTAPATGKLIEWNGEQGKTYGKEDSIGQVETTIPTAENPMNTISVDVKLPTSATIVTTKAVKDSLVAAGTPLAYAYDFGKLYVVANIKENVLEDVEVGQEVDIYVDAFQDATLTGKVEELGLATASTFSMLPSGNANANYTKVTQVVPVKISISDKKGYNILPGMNVSVRIHK